MTQLRLDDILNFLCGIRMKREVFLNNLEQLGVEYPELSDAERWVYEDAIG